LRLRIALVAYEYDGCVIHALLDELASGDAVLSVARHGCLMILWLRTGDDSEAWFSVEPTGLRCLYRH
jgi:hypothetical protein